MPAHENEDAQKESKCLHLFSFYYLTIGYVVRCLATWVDWSDIYIFGFIYVPNELSVEFFANLTVPIFFASTYVPHL